MITKYILKSNSFNGSVVFGFDDEGQCKFYENESEMNQKQSSWLFNNFPFTMEKLEALKPIIQGKLELIPVDLSFNVFWELYKKKVHKKRCEPIWAKMSDADRVLCLMSIKSYENYLKRVSRGKLDPENYLRKASYENNWNQLTS